MPIFSMYDFCSTVNPDYTGETLILKPQGVMWETGDKAVEIHEGRGVSEEAVILCDESVFFVQLTWKAISDSESGILFSLFHDPTKACGRARSFKWQHPTDGHTYVVKFRDKLPRFKENAPIYGFSTLTFKVMGRIND